MGDVRLAAIEKRFDSVRVLEALDLDVSDGEFLVLLGPSGCGKTTALRIIAGLEKPTSGRVFIAGRDVTDKAPRERDVAMVFQSYALYPHMSIEQNIEYPRKAAVAAVAESLEVSHLLARRPRQLSGGQRQRIALARAIVREPQVFLMDEPLSNLDAKLRLSMRGEIKRLQKRLGTTTIYVTHDQAEAMTMADRVCLLRDGFIQQCAPAQEVFDRPANRFVAGFVGNPPMNIIDLELDPEHRSAVVAGSPVPLGGRFDECAASAVTQLGARAGDLVLAPADAPGVLQATVYVVEPMGEEVYVDVLVGERRVTVRAERGWTAPIGQAIGVRLDPDKACFFDANGMTVVHRVGV
jgi:multiple sugar transport system ATP-binding protein